MRWIRVFLFIFLIVSASKAFSHSDTINFHSQSIDYQANQAMLAIVNEILKIKTSTLSMLKTMGLV